MNTETIIKDVSSLDFGTLRKILQRHDISWTEGKGFLSRDFTINANESDSKSAISEYYDLLVDMQTW